MGNAMGRGHQPWSPRTTCGRRWRHAPEAAEGGGGSREPTGDLGSSHSPNPARRWVPPSPAPQQPRHREPRSASTRGCSLLPCSSASPALAANAAVLVYLESEGKPESSAEDRSTLGSRTTATESNLSNSETGMSQSSLSPVQRNHGDPHSAQNQRPDGVRWASPSPPRGRPVPGTPRARAHGPYASRVSTPPDHREQPGPAVLCSCG